MRVCFPAPLPWLVLGFFVAVLPGCGGGSTYSLDSGGLAQRFLPTERSVDHHPDSLEALSITKSDGTYSYELDQDYEALHQKWSCTYQDFGAGRSRRGRSYATFWSLELSLASLQPEVGITSLRQKQARKALKRRRQEYRSTIQIDVYWFEAEGTSLLAGPGRRVELRIGGEEYRPKREDHGPLREAFLPTQSRTALYRRNSFHFPRVVDSTDLLKNNQRMELRVNRSGDQSRIRFAWSWKEADQESARGPRGSETDGLYGVHPSGDEGGSARFGMFSRRAVKMSRDGRPRRSRPTLSPTPSPIHSP